MFSAKQLFFETFLKERKTLHTFLSSSPPIFSTLVSFNGFFSVFSFCFFDTKLSCAVARHDLFMWGIESQNPIENLTKLALSETI